jgi:hypothetical protein
MYYNNFINNYANENILFYDIVPRQKSVMEKTLLERYDPNGIYSGEITVSV